MAEFDEEEVDGAGHALCVRAYGPGSEGWTDGHLQFTVNDEVFDVKLVSAEWAEGTVVLGGQRGLFPLDSIEWSVTHHAIAAYQTRIAELESSLRARDQQLTLARAAIQSMKGNVGWYIGILLSIALAGGSVAFYGRPAWQMSSGNKDATADVVQHNSRILLGAAAFLVFQSWAFANFIRKRADASAIKAHKVGAEAGDSSSLDFMRNAFLFVLSLCAMAFAIQSQVVANQVPLLVCALFLLTATMTFSKAVCDSQVAARFAKEAPVH